MKHSCSRLPFGPFMATAMMAELPCLRETSEDSDAFSDVMAEPYTPVEGDYLMAEAHTPQRCHTTLADWFQPTPKKRRSGEDTGLRPVLDDLPSQSLAHHRVCIGDLFQTGPCALPAAATASASVGR